MEQQIHYLWGFNSKNLLCNSSGDRHWSLREFMRNKSFSSRFGERKREGDNIQTVFPPAAYIAKREQPNSAFSSQISNRDKPLLIL